MSIGTDTGGSKRASSASTSHESVIDHTLTHNVDIAPPQVGKFCCVCAKNVAGEERFKDKLGRYWCYDCGKTDSEKKHANDLLNCQDCGQSVKRADIVQFDNLKICEHCKDKRTRAARREKARIAAAEQEAREAELRKKRLTLAAIIAVVALAFCAVWMFLL